MGHTDTVEISVPESHGSSSVISERPETMNASEPARLEQTSSEKPWSVEAVLERLPKDSVPKAQPDSPIPFFHMLERLKTTKREGWRRFGISAGESIADHMYRMSIITMLCPASLASRLNIPRCTQMALVHDMAESLVGDITPVDGVSKPEKSRRERETMHFLGHGLLKDYNNGISGESLKELWEEYEAGETLEAVFVHDVDKLELVLQMIEYERRGECQIDLGEFAWVSKKIQLEETRAWCQELLNERAKMWEAFGKTPINVAVMER